MKRTGFYCCAIAGCLALFAGCVEQGEKVNRYAFITNGVAEFWVLAQRGAEDAADELGVKATVLMPADAVDQQSQVEDSIARGFSGIAISPIDPENQNDLLNQAAAATVLITHDSDAPDSNRLVYVGMDNYTAGRLCGELVREALPNGGKVMLMIGRLGQDNAERRRQGTIDGILDRSVDATRSDPVNEVIEENGFTILGTLTDEFNTSKAKANAEDTLSRHPDIDAMVGLFAYNPPAIIQALEQAGKLGEIQIIGFDEDAQTLAGIESGSVYGTVVQNPYQYGYQSIELLHRIAIGDFEPDPENPAVEIAARQVRKDNVVAIREEIEALLSGGAEE
ncbi:MAG: sugar-binding protein [Verrucomicrobiota bacterium]